MLDEHHRHRSAQSADALAELAHLVRAETPGGLVEQQQARLADERACERHALLHRVGERGRQAGRDVLASQVRQRRERALAQRALVAIGSRQAQEGARDTRAAEALRADHHVLEHGQAWKQTHALQRARNAKPGEPVRTDLRQLPTVPLERPRLRLHEAADDVEQRRLAGAVGADDTQDFATGKLEGDRVKRSDAAKAHRQRTCGKRSIPGNDRIASHALEATTNPA